MKVGSSDVGGRERESGCCFPQDEDERETERETEAAARGFFQVDIAQQPR